MTPSDEAEDTPVEQVRLSSLRPGRRYRVVQDFRDYDGQLLTAGTTLTFVSQDYFPYDGGRTLHFAERVVRLAEIVDANDEIIVNAGNAWVAPAD